jgi:mannobiose 2-epimerase
MKKEKYWKGFSQTLEWIVSHQVDWNHGDWHRKIEPGGYPTGYKFDAWKAPYHNGRAMLECSEILNRLTE